MQVDVGAGADVAGHHAADQPRAKAGQQPHQPQGLEPHVAEVVRARVAFVQAGEGLDLVADFGVAGQIGRLDPALADAVGGLLLGPVVFRLLARVHQPGGFARRFAAGVSTGSSQGAESPKVRRVAAMRSENRFGSRTAAESRTWLILRRCRERECEASAAFST